MSLHNLCRVLFHFYLLVTFTFCSSRAFSGLSLSYLKRRMNLFRNVAVVRTVVICFFLVNYVATAGKVYQDTNSAIDITNSVCAFDTDRNCLAPNTPKQVPSDSTSFFTGKIKSWLTNFYPGPNQVPLTYIKDLTKLLRPSASWSGFFCNDDIRGCPDKKNFPGPHTHSQMGYNRVRDLISQMPRNEWSGKWWRGNELGTLIVNPLYFYRKDPMSGNATINPLSVGLGMKPAQHAIIRPLLERVFTIDDDRFEDVRAYVEKTVVTLLKRQKEHGNLTHTDLKVWFHQVINKLTFNREVSAEYCLGFIKTQSNVLSTTLLSQALPAPFYRSDPLKLKQTLAETYKYIDEYKALIKEQHADLLEGKDCSPSVSCFDQAAYGIFDAFLNAGGVAVPGTVLQGELILPLSLLSNLPLTADNIQNS